MNASGLLAASEGFLRYASGAGGKWRPARNEEHDMSKGMNQKKAEKKKPLKTLKEKRAEKSARKAGKSAHPG